MGLSLYYSAILAFNFSFPWLWPLCLLHGPFDQGIHLVHGEPFKNFPTRELQNSCEFIKGFAFYDKGIIFSGGSAFVQNRPETNLFAFIHVKKFDQFFNVMLFARQDEATQPAPDRFWIHLSRLRNFCRLPFFRRV